MRGTHMTRPYRHVLCAGLALVLLGACGQKGPLYLPDKNGKQAVTASPDASRPPEKIDPEKKDDSQQPPSP
jgi:predicted small lipoprotein YifL